MGSTGRRAARQPRRGLVRAVFGSVRTRAALGLGLVLSLCATGTFAYWTDEVTVSGTTFTTGTIDLKVNNSDTVTGYTTLSLSTMVPGNSVAGVLTIKNGGTAPMKYTASTTATNADSKNLRGSLQVKVTSATTVTGTSPSATCGGTALANTATTLNGTLLSVGRQLNAGASESFCVQVTLDAAAPTSVQGGTTDVVFTFSGTSDLT